jgi:hypothetical protein
VVVGCLGVPGIDICLGCLGQAVIVLVKPVKEVFGMGELLAGEPARG